ncbi:MAG: hypothetical protein KAI24_15410, partial [Planctomycetes bacterium]|nr:hypothetical protein [Planctomycetota bacterium]
QYVELVRRGLELRPRAVVVTIYLGNDLIDAWDYAGLVGAEPLRSDDVAYVVRDNPEFHGEHSPNLTMAIVDAVLAGSALLDRAATVVKSRLRGGAFDQVAGSVPFEHETLATVLQPDYRHPVVDRAQPKVRDGIDVTRRCVAAIAALCEQQGARLVVAVLPTKERVYADFAELPACAELADDERRAHDLLFGAGLPDGAVLVDLSAPLLDAMGRGDMPWFSSADGHLAAGGHRAVARALRERLGW